LVDGGRNIFAATFYLDHADQLGSHEKRVVGWTARGRPLGNRHVAALGRADALGISQLLCVCLPATESISRDLQSTARTLGLQLHILNASTEHDFDAVFATFAQLRADALVIAPDAMFISRSEQLGALTLRHAVPAITQFREFAAAGGLMSYGGSSTEAARLVGVYTGRILKGEKPADLPIQQSTKVEFVINLRTAKALGLNVPNTLIGRADEVIE
jgi:putative ABC transport system substrate-binding protein